MKELLKIVDEYSDLILSAEKYLWKNPESGYKEFKTSKYMAEEMQKLGYELDFPKDITGFCAIADTGRVGPTVLVLAELDSLINDKHPDCDKETKCVHNCGHHVQCAAMLGLAAVLKRKEVLDRLCGKIKLLVVPSEEGIEVEYRKSLIEKGVIEFTSGKPEFIKRGYLNDVDVAFMLHVMMTSDEKKFKLSSGHNGVVRKSTKIMGKAAHAGANPHDGINALNVANLTLLAINSLRETFREKDYVRVHSIITKGGSAVNAVPDEVTIESYVRAANPSALKEVNKKVNQTISACAAAFGANVEITDLAGSEALIPDQNLTDLAEELLIEYVGKDEYQRTYDWVASSTDMGDVSTLVPSLHAYVGGTKGSAHGVDFLVTDPYLACVEGAKFELGLVIKLLENDGEKAKQIMANFKPSFNTIEEYLEHKRSFNIKRQTVKYNKDGTITLDL